MPQVVGAIGAKVIGATFAIAVSTTSTIAILAGLGTIALGAAALRALTPKPTIKATGYNVTARGSALDHQIVYGQTRVAGVEVFKATTGTNNAYLHLVLAFTGHEIESFEDIWINDEKATLDGNGNVTTVTTEEGDTSSRYNNKLTIIKRLGGTDNATPPSFGSSPDRPTDAGWTSDHKLTGISYLYCRLKFDRDAFPNGIPEIQATIKGKKVYNPDTEATAWSDNPALCIRDYLTSSGYGLGEATSAIDDTLFVSAAEACDATADESQTRTIWSTSYTLGAKKYTLNGAFTTATKPVDALEEMLTAMGGTLWYAQGKWRVKAAKWYAPTVTLDEDDLRSGMTINTRHSFRDNFNTIKGTFKGIESNYIETDYQQFPKDDSSNSFITADNGQKNVIDIPLAFTDNSVTARRLARIALERHRQQLTFTASFGMKAFQLQVGDVVNITNTRMGWSSKAFEIVSWTFTTGQDLELLVEMSLRETAESVFDEVDDGVVYERDNTTLFSPFFVPSVSLDSPFSSNAMNSDGTAVPFIDFSWTPADPSRIDYYVFEWSTDAGVTYNPTTTSGTTFRLSPTETGKTYLYRVTPYNYLGVKGTTVTSAVGVAATADGTTPNAPESLSASGGYRTTTVTWTEPTTNTDDSTLTDLKYYRVYRGTTTSPTTEVGVTFSNIFTDGGLADGTQYYYRVKAVDRTGNESAYSTETNVTTNAELVDGINSASVFLYKANTSSTTAPNDPTGTFTYTFSTGVLSGGTLDGWSQTPPDLSEGDYLWAITATAASRNSTDSVPASEFSDAFVFTESANAYRSATVTLYKKNTSGTTAPDDPTGPFTYTFATATLTTSGDFDGWSQSAPSLDKGEYLWVIQATAFNNATTDSIAASEFSTAVIGGIGGEDGTNGTSAKLVRLTADAQSFTYDGDGNADPSSQTITFTAALQNTTDTTATFTTSPSVTLGGTGNSKTLTVANFGSNTSVAVTASADSGAATDTFTVYKLQQGSTGVSGLSALTVILSNESHTLAAATDGTVSSYTGSGTTIRLFEGTTELAYDGSGTTNGTWTVSASGTGITAGSLTDSGDYVTVGDHSSMTSDTATVTYTITGKRSGGGSISLTKTQSLSKSKQGATGTGTQGERGAGRWYIGVTSLPTTSSGADSDFTSAIGNPVDRDQAWFYEGTVANPTAQNVWIYTESTDTWVVQEEFIDGNLVVAGTITSDKINTNAVTADKIQAGAVSADKMTIDGELVLGNDAGFLAGRSFNSAYEDDGFFVGRETRADGTQGFELSTSSVNGNNELTGIIHNEQDHLKIFNPVLLIGGNVSGGVDTYASTQTVDLGVNTGRTITVTAYGGGGGGGGGHDDRGDNQGGTGAQGGTTTVKIYHTSTSSESNLITTVTASGGAGGQSGGGARAVSGGNGEATPFGSGGAGGALNSAGSDAPSTSYGAGGGGGGGDDSGLFDRSGAAGLGGAAAVPVIENINITQTTNIYAVITAIGSGGAGDTTGVDYYGGDGAGGAVSISSVFGGTYALPAKEITPMDIFALMTLPNTETSFTVGDEGSGSVRSDLRKSNSQDTLWLFDGWSNATTNGDWWLGGSGRIITQWGYEGQLPNSDNRYLWNERDFIASSGTNYYRSSNSYASIYASCMIYFEAGTWMDSDRVATFNNVRFITEANIPSGYSVEDIARIYLRNLKDYNH